MIIKFDRIATLVETGGKYRLTVLPPIGGVDNIILYFYKCVYTHVNDENIVYSTVMSSPKKLTTLVDAQVLAGSIMSDCKTLYTKMVNTSKVKLCINCADSPPYCMMKHLGHYDMENWKNVLPDCYVGPPTMRPHKTAMPRQLTEALHSLAKTVHPALCKYDYRNVNHLNVNGRFNYSEYPTSIYYTSDKLNAEINYKYNEVFVINAQYNDTKREVEWVLFAPEVLGCVEIK